MNGRQSRGRHVAEAGRKLPIKRGEKFCADGAHDDAKLADGQACPNCGAAR